LLAPNAGDMFQLVEVYASAKQMFLPPTVLPKDTQTRIEKKMNHPSARGSVTLK